MNYHHQFDRLGNQVARPTRTPLVHRIIQGLGLLFSLVLLVLLYGASAT